MLNIENDNKKRYIELVNEWAKLEVDNKISGDSSKNRELQDKIAKWMENILKDMMSRDLSEAVREQNLVSTVTNNNEFSEKMSEENKKTR